ncbi:MAG: dipeptidyl-peptidase IV [Clostridium sp.]|nr:dipeptidyl-peptidase IV [Clostridium sp.]
MKRFNRIIIWMLLSIMMQCAGLIFLDKVFFRHSSDFEISERQQTASVTDLTVNIPSNAKNIQVSFDGKYISYNVDDKFYLADTKTGESNEVVTSDGDKVLYAEWLPDRNRITIAEKIISSGKSVINIINYDAKSNTKYQLKEICRYQDGMKVDGIVTTTLSGVSYISVSKNGNNSSIYRIDINEKMKKLGVKIASLGSMKIFPHKDVLLYQDSVSKLFYYYKNEKNYSIKTGTYSNLKLLSVDNNDVVYMGEITNKKISKVIYGTLDSDISSWKTINIDKPKDVKDLYVNEKGELLVNDNLQGVVVNMTTGAKVTYNGMFISVNNKVICSSDNEQTYIKSLSETD